LTLTFEQFIIFKMVLKLCAVCALPETHPAMAARRRRFRDSLLFSLLVYTKSFQEKLPLWNLRSGCSSFNEHDKALMERDEHDAEGCQASAAAVEFAHLIGKLKTTPRTGWVRRGVPRYESVADHSWRVAALTLLLHGNEDIDAAKCMQMAVVHDLAECVVGDIAPDDNVSKADKEFMEHAAIEKVSSLLQQAQNDDGDLSSTHLLELFHEYEKRQSTEAIAVKDLDRLDMILQAEEYEQAFGTDLSDFFEGTPPGGFRNPTLQKIASQVHQRREERLQQQNHCVEEVKKEILSKRDAAFVSEYAQASDLDAESIQKVVQALRGWESRGTKSN